jgi:acyl-coenzyme A thioesterase PaaI-like protein
MNRYFFDLLAEAETSAFKLRLLNWMLPFVVPFNRPHKFRLLSITRESVRVSLPFKRVNHNHIRSLHACAMATAAEFASGLLLLRNLDAGKYRLIMKNLNVEYLYQGRMAAVAEVGLEGQAMERLVLAPLESEGAVLIELPATLSDSDGNVLCRARILWQVKSWQKIREGRSFERDAA